MKDLELLKGEKKCNEVKKGKETLNWYNMVLVVLSKMKDNLDI